ncbi:MAG: TetR/AcrR family transcriptional regulator [Candidatus Binatia bacterium]|nr:TetR/AcrR family transcriptional regulator [Candidatus Binatia bacterium]
MSAPVLEEPGRREEILGAARTIFAHYGFRRASLEEIAREAGISRTALYHHFRNKEDIFRAMCDGIYVRATEKAEEAAATQQPVDAKLLAVLEAQVGWIFRQLASSRHGLEIVDESNRLCADITGAWSRRSVKLLTRVLQTAQDEGGLDASVSGNTPESAAGFLLLCAHGLQGPSPANAPSTAQYGRRLAGLVRLSVAGLGGKVTTITKER